MKRMMTTRLIPSRTSITTRTLRGITRTRIITRTVIVPIATGATLPVITIPSIMTGSFTTRISTIRSFTTPSIIPASASGFPSAFPSIATTAHSDMPTARIMVASVASVATMAGTGGIMGGMVSTTRFIVGARFSSLPPAVTWVRGEARWGVPASRAGRGAPGVTTAAAARATGWGVPIRTGTRAMGSIAAQGPATSFAPVLPARPANRARPLEAGARWIAAAVVRRLDVVRIAPVIVRRPVPTGAAPNGVGPRGPEG